LDFQEMSLPGRALRAARNVCAPHLTPIGGLLRSLRRRSLAVVMYHGVTDKQPAIPDDLQVLPEDFRRQMDFLRQEYCVLPLGEAVQRISRGLPVADRTVCLTFDDGLRNVLTHAAPVLKAYGLPSTVFLITSLPDSRLPPWQGRLRYALGNTILPSIHFDGEDWTLHKGRAGLPVYNSLVRRIKTLPGRERELSLTKLIGALCAPQPLDFSESPHATMGWDDVTEAAAGGLMRFESHTHTHASLSHCASEELRYELETSRDLLRERLPIENLFCYPFGDYSPATTAMVAQAGYRCALITGNGINRRVPDVYRLRRVSVGADMTAARFEMAMLGWCE
jgi:peptidoglycan/xylan/chitin deacetylase (PgdA/CDA1 family)